VTPPHKITREASITGIVDYYFDDSTMVRHKTRWLLVRIDFADDLRGLSSVKWDADSKRKGEPTDDDYPSKKDLAKVIRNSVIACSGVAASGAALDTQGKTFALSVHSLLDSPRGLF
jgi:hypothetical protein